MVLKGALLGCFGAVLALGLLVACGSSKRAGNGAECFVATDCQEPLVCIEQKDQTRRCTDNLDSVVGEAPPEAGGPDTGQNNAGDGGGKKETGPTGEPDTGAGTTDQ